MYLHRHELPKYGRYEENCSSKIFSCIRASANTGPTCIGAKINSPRIFSCMYWFCAGGYISNSLKILLCKLCNALHAHYIFVFPEKFLCKAELSRYFEYVVLCAPKSAANSRIVVLCAPESAAKSRILCSVHLKVLQFPGHEKGGTSLGKKTGDPLHSHYVETFQKNYFYVISGRLLHINIRPEMFLCT